MASIVLRGVGSAIGGLVGGPIGAAVGAALGGMIGSGIDSSFTKPAKHNIYGSRLNSLAIQTSTYGKPIDLLFGECRLAGNVIWALPLREHEHVSEVTVGGGKGRKPKISSTNYSYTVTCAIAICRGRIDLISNIWADAKIITSELQNIRIYKGTEDQLPDPLIEAHMGAGKTPAYRGLAYVVFEDFPLGDYGNRIPNFSFEVRRRPQNHGKAKDAIPEDMLKAICMIPGSGEFVYDTTVQYKIPGEGVGNGHIQTGKSYAINMNNLYRKADSLVSLDQLGDTCQNLKWIAPVVTWFATSLDAGKCKIVPGVEFRNIHTAPDLWQVAGRGRAQAHTVTLKKGNPIYGGTVSDLAVIRYLQELKARGYKVMLYPMIFLDLMDKPWRGHMKGSAKDVKDFFEKPDGYNSFIIHYANLAKGKVDAFIIGSELKNLTKVRDENKEFIAVECLIKLANIVKGILGRNVIVTYAADWSEYHHTDDGWYSLDKLWACPSIDVVGIDAYFPLTENIAYSPTEDEIIQGWTSGEGHDYYFTDSQKKNGKKIPLAPHFAWKNIKWWWENSHTNPDGQKTPWVPKSKKIWFTEFGFPSVDGAANQPNVFYDPECFDGGLPISSKGMTDFRSQRNAIRATLKYWQDSEMVENLFLWTWDARPYPYWPSLRRVWADGDKWLKGHWVNGKFGVSSLADVVLEICVEAGLDASQVDTSDLVGFVSGYVVNSIDSARNIIENLARAYFFTLIESDGKIKFISQKSSKEVTISKSDLIYKQSQLINISRRQEQDLPRKVEILYLDRTNYYQQSIIRHENYQTSSNRSIVLDSNLVLDHQMAENIAYTIMNNAWNMRHDFEFYLPFKYINLEPGDLLKIDSKRVRINKISLVKDSILELSATSEDITISERPYEPQFNLKIEDQLSKPNYIVHILDIPLKIGACKAAPLLHIAVSNSAGPFSNASVYYSDSEGDSDYKFLNVITEEAVIGTTHNKLLDAHSDVFDLSSKIVVSLISGSLFSVDFDRIINGDNVAMVGSEIVQFMNAQLVSPGKYELSGFLRGRMGTEHLVNNHQEQERFILLNNRVKAFEMPINRLNYPCKYKIIAEGMELNEEEARDFSWQANSLKPLAPVHLKPHFIKGNMVLLSWVRRVKINGDWRSNIEAPLDEQEEKYEIDVLVNDDVVDTIITNQSNSLIDISKYIEMPQFHVYQISSLVGRGHKQIFN